MVRRLYTIEPNMWEYLYTGTGQYVPEGVPSTGGNPRVLIVTPEVSYLPAGMGNIANYLEAKAGGLGDVSASLIDALFRQGADVHVAIPDYRVLYNANLPPLLRRGIQTLARNLPEERIHLAQDSAFYRLMHVYAEDTEENLKIAVAFQREVINNIIPAVRPDLIHCNDWTTGLIPAAAREAGIPCLFTVHNIHTVECALEAIEDRGIDPAEFWQNLYYNKMPHGYDQAVGSHVDFLASGIFAAHFVNVVSPTFLMEIAQGRHSFVPDAVRGELSNKVAAQCAAGILNAPDPSFDPNSDPYLSMNYDDETHAIGKNDNKLKLQAELGLAQDKDAPMIFWPSRLDYFQKGCQLLAENLYDILSKYWSENLQLVFVADGPFKQVFHNIVGFHGFEHRVALCDYQESYARVAYAAADFILMPSLFEPCGLPQMIGTIYGSLPIAHNTGGIHDTVRHLDVHANTGNGFLFDIFDGVGIKWAIDEAMKFFKLPKRIKDRNIGRVMKESASKFNHATTAQQYIALYERMLQRPLVGWKIAQQNRA